VLGRSWGADFWPAFIRLTGPTDSSTPSSLTDNFSLCPKLSTAMSLVRHFRELQQRHESDSLQGGPGPPIELQQAEIVSLRVSTLTVQPPLPVSNISVVAQAIQSCSGTEAVVQTPPIVNGCPEPSVAPHTSSSPFAQTSSIKANTAAEIEASIPVAEYDSLARLQPVPSTRNIRKQIVKHTVEVKAQNNIVTRLFTRETASLPSLSVT